MGIPNNTIRGHVANRKSDIMWEFPIIQSGAMWPTGNLSKKVKSIMYNRIGKKIKLVAASARVAT